jgi:heat shock protein HtpX
MDFRKQIEKNQRLTIMVILTYVLIMYFVGILADIAINAEKGIGFLNNVIIFMTFQKVPYVTMIIMAITLSGICLIHFFGHKFMMSDMHYTEVNENEKDLKRIQAYNALKEMSISAGLRYVPKFYIMETSELNAFASGWSKANACVAVTSGLMMKLNRSEIQAVIAHEVGHIVHGDSKLTMYVGILANVILTVTNLFSNMFFMLTSRDTSKESSIAKILLLILNLILPIITRVLYLYLSRTREYMADAASVKLTGNDQAMISALEKISNENEENSAQSLSVGDSFRQAAYIYSGASNLFSTHPRIKDRITAIDPTYFNTKLNNRGK